MRKIMAVGKLLICAVIVTFLFLYPSRCVLSEEAEKSQAQQTPEMKNYIQKSESRAREEELARKKEEQKRQKQLAAEQKEQKAQLNEQAKTIYNEAVSLYKAGNYQQAQVKFEQIAKLIPNYAGTNSYLNRISKEIQKEKERREAELKKQQTQLEKEQKIKQEAEAREQQRLEQEKQKQLELAKKEQERLKTEKIQQEKLAQAKKIDSIYKNAIALYNKNQFEEASSLFNQVLSLDPEHRTAKDYLNKRIPNRVKQLQAAPRLEEERIQMAEQKRSEKQIQKQQELKKESKVEAKYKKIDAKVEESKSAFNETARAIYKEAIALYNAGEYAQAKAKFEQVKQIDPTHSNTDYYLKRIPQKIAEHKEWTEAQKKQEEKTAKRIKIASLSNKAISFYDEGKLAEAAALFKQILLLDPENGRAKYYLENKMPSDVTKLPEPAQEKQDMGKAEKERKQKEEQAKLEEKQNQEQTVRKEEQERQKQLASEQKEQERQLNEQAKAIYNEAVSLYGAGNYKQAQAKFEQTAKLIPNYARTDYYLSRIPQDIQKEKERFESEYKKQQEKLEREQKIKQEAEEKEKQLELKKIEQQNKQKEKKSVPNREIESLYKKATSLYDQNQLDEAKILFLEILSLDPTEPRALDYIDNKIPRRSRELPK